MANYSFLVGASSKKVWLDSGHRETVSQKRHHTFVHFPARCTIVHGAVLRLHACRPSTVHPSVCPFVRDVGGSGPHRLEIFALGSPKAIHLLPGEPGEILGRLEVVWKKVPCWRLERKSGNISETRKDRAKYTGTMDGL